MGHIDHGKSTLLDYIRQTNLTEREAGGITQAIGAYQVKGITFIDTPGHQAFVAMRESGASVADIAILVVSTEDGVKPQTIEAAKIITEQKLPFIVALNKIDKPNANIERAKQELAENNIFLEGYGGKVPVAEISAKTGAGVSELLDLILLVAELEPFTGDIAAPASGVVLEAKIDPRAGITSTLIIKNGRLRRGDFIVAGVTLGKIKQLRDCLGQEQTELGLSAPAVITGWEELPQAGRPFTTFTDKVAAEARVAAVKAAPGAIFAKGVEAVSKVATEMIGGNNLVELPLIIKSGTQGGAEAARHEVSKLGSEQVKINILEASAGEINEADVKNASASKQSVIIGFQTKASKSAGELAERLGVTIVEENIIYKLTEWLGEEIKRREPATNIAQITSRAKVLKIFNRTKDKQVIGGQVSEGAIRVGELIKIIRREAEIGQGKIVELQQNRLPVKEVTAEQQFGAMINSKITIAVGDILEN